VLLPTELWLLVLQYLGGCDLKSLTLVASYFKDLCGPGMAGTILLSQQSIADRAPPPLFLKQAHTLKLYNDDFLTCLVVPYASPYKELGEPRPTLINLVLANVVLSHHLFWHLLSIPSIRTLELLTLVVNSADAITSLSTLGYSHAGALRSHRMSAATAGYQLPRLNLDKLVICDLGNELILEVLKHTNDDLRELRLDSGTAGQTAAILGKWKGLKKCGDWTSPPKSLMSPSARLLSLTWYICRAIKDSFQTY
jgi:hypothetical protein